MADRQTTPAHPWDVHDDSCDCHIGICGKCGCTNEAEARSIPVASEAETWNDGFLAGAAVMSKPDVERLAEAIPTMLIDLASKDARLAFAARIIARLASPVVRTEEVIERLDRPGNRADGVRTEGSLE